MSNNIELAFLLAYYIDNARWKLNDGGSSLVNYSVMPEDIKDEEKRAEYIILSHWLTYICERQMAFSQIWNNGGFVFSSMVGYYQEYDRMVEDFIREVIKKHIEVYKKDDSSKIRFFTIVKDDFKNTRVDSDKVATDESGQKKVWFASRFVASDMISILRTLQKLLQYRNINNGHTGLYNYLHEDSLDFTRNEPLKYLLYKMYLLTYYNISQPKSGDLTDGKSFDYEKINAYFPKSVHYEPLKFEKYCENQVFSSKRAICALRDYFKHHEYKEPFRFLIGKDTFEKLSSMLDQLELPGDVWNNNSKFGKCMCQIGIPSQSTRSTALRINQALRKAFIDYSPKKGYPEQFDISFDFVPRMCEFNKCNICLFAKLNPNKEFNESDFIKFCSGQKDKICPLLLKYCGYEISCDDAIKCKGCLKEFYEDNFEVQSKRKPPTYANQIGGGN